MTSDLPGPDVVEVGDGVWVSRALAAELNSLPEVHQLRRTVRGRNHRADTLLQALCLAGIRSTTGAGSDGGRSLATPAAHTPRLITTQEAARRIGITDRAVRRAITEGRLPADRCGLAYLVTERDADRYVARRSA